MASEGSLRQFCDSPCRMPAGLGDPLHRPALRSSRGSPSERWTLTNTKRTSAPQDVEIGAGRRETERPSRQGQAAGTGVFANPTWPPNPKKRQRPHHAKPHGTCLNAARSAARQAATSHRLHANVHLGRGHARHRMLVVIAFRLLPCSLQPGEAARA